MILITLHPLKCLFFVLNWCYFSRGVKEVPFDNLHFRFVWAMRGRALEVTIAKIISWTEKAEKNKNSQHDTLITVIIIVVVICLAKLIPNIM